MSFPGRDSVAPESPKQTTITQRVIIDRYDTLRVEGYRMPLAPIAQIRRVFGDVPEGDYSVTYTVDPYGDHKVTRESSCGGCIVKRISSDDGAVVCFIPPTKAWLGKRVVRRVDYD
jgi:hypothetical protein